jgi:predicted GIY-YIG superfamily endonuclease
LTDFHYVYILTSESGNTRHYTGITTSLKSRLKAHNSGPVFHTAKYLPWHIETIVAFRNQDKAIAFEKHLKSHSDRAFAKKRL